MTQKPWVSGSLIACVLIGSAGCGQVIGRQQLTKEVLAKDPEFETVLGKYRNLTNRIETYQRELALKRSTVEQNIAQMRKDLAASTANVKTRIAEVQKQIEPDRQRLQLALSMAEEELRVKRFQRASLGRSMAQLRKASTQSQGTWSDDERKRQDQKIAEMLHDAKRIDQEITSLKTHMRLLKIKMLLLQF